MNSPFLDEKKKLDEALKRRIYTEAEYEKKLSELGKLYKEEINSIFNEEIEEDEDEEESALKEHAVYVDVCATMRVREVSGRLSTQHINLSLRLPNGLLAIEIYDYLERYIGEHYRFEGDIEINTVEVNDSDPELEEEEEE
jgi:hypothetical protein